MTGTVYRSTGSWYEVKGDDGQFYPTRIKGKFRLQGIKSTNPVAVGDRVEFSLEKKGDEQIGIIDTILDRENYIIRRSVNLSKQTHIIAANVDQVFLVVTIDNPPTFTSFIDRFLVTARAYRVPVILLFNKIDTYDDTRSAVEEDSETGESMLEMTPLDQVRLLMHIYKKVGYKCLAVSASTGKNISSLKELMEGKTSMFAGHSGAGKSTLANAVDPELALKTSEISLQHRQGQHTTTFAQMYDLENNSRIIDTPGVKGFGIVDMEKEEIGDYFPEIFALKNECKFHNCLHINEPKCAVKDAVKSGDIFESRYESYLQLVEGEDSNYRIDKYS